MALSPLCVEAHLEQCLVEVWLGAWTYTQNNCRVGDRAVLWGTDNGLEINNAGFEHSQPAPGSAKGFFLIFKIVSLECKVQTLEGGRGWGMIFSIPNVT